MEIFWRLVLGHLIADFTLQTNYIAAWKRRNLTGLFVHCIIHPLIYSILLWNYLGQVWIKIGPVELTGTLCLFIIFASHFIEDHWRIWSVLKNNSPDNTFFYLWDQVVHYAVIFAISPAIEGSASKFGFISYPSISGIFSAVESIHLNVVQRFFTIVRPEPWIFIGILLTLITHFTTVSIYFLEKDFLQKEFPSNREKYIGIMERLVIVLCFMLPGNGWILVVAVWVFRIILLKTKKWIPVTWMNIIFGNLQYRYLFK